MNDVAVRRFGASLRRSPYVWLGATVLLLFVMNAPLGAVAKEPGSGNLWMALVAAGFAIYAVCLWFLLPRFLDRRSEVKDRDDRFAVLAWTLALCPYLSTYAAAAGGAEQWVYGLGFVTSVVLLVASARSIRRREAMTAP